MFKWFGRLLDRWADGRAYRRYQRDVAYSVERDLAALRHPASRGRHAAPRPDEGESGVNALTDLLGTEGGSEQ